MSNVPPFIKDELNTELFRTNRFTNEENKSPLLKHVALSETLTEHFGELKFHCFFFIFIFFAKER